MLSRQQLPPPILFLGAGREVGALPSFTRQSHTSSRAGSEEQWKGNSPSIPPLLSASGSCGQGRTSSWAFTALLVPSHLSPGKNMVA